MRSLGRGIIAVVFGQAVADISDFFCISQVFWAIKFCRFVWNICTFKSAHWCNKEVGSSELFLLQITISQTMSSSQIGRFTAESTTIPDRDLNPARYTKLRSGSRVRAAILPESLCSRLLCVFSFISPSTVSINCVLIQSIHTVGVLLFFIIYRVSAEAYPHQVCNNESQSNRVHWH